MKPASANEISVAPFSVHSDLGMLLPLYLCERAAERAMVLATLIDTRGSTYRKPGAQLLLADNGVYAGLLSGGCLEGDLCEHAQGVRTSNTARIVEYNLNHPDDTLFGLDAGCAGSLRILLQPISAHNQWQPLAYLAHCWQQYRYQPIALMTHSEDPQWPLGTVIFAAGEAITPQGIRHSMPWSVTTALSHPAQRGGLQPLSAATQAFVLHTVLPPKLLILGAGDDAQLLAANAHLLGWQITVIDHRAALISAERFTQAHRICLRPEQLNAQSLDDYAAAVIMSHQLTADAHYLRALAHTHIPYIGLLGPAARRQRLFDELGEQMALLWPRLHAPVGLDLGAATPPAIALSIIAQIQQTLSTPPFVKAENHH